MVHGDVVYILRANAPADAYPAVAAEFEAMIGSLEWLMP
jgi:hypothetical protein